MENAPNPLQNLSYTKAKGLPGRITLRIAPVLIMVSDLQYKRDGIMNGVREYMDSCNLVIWVILRHKKI